MAPSPGFSSACSAAESAREPAGPRLERLEKRGKKRDVDHRGLVDDHEIGFERLFGVAGEPFGGGVELEQAVKRHGFAAGQLAEAPRGAAGRRRESDPNARLAAK